MEKSPDETINKLIVDYFRKICDLQVSMFLSITMKITNKLLIATKSRTFPGCKIGPDSISALLNFQLKWRCVFMLENQLPQTSAHGNIRVMTKLLENPHRK